MPENKRIILAGFLIASLFLITPFYLQFIGVSSSEAEEHSETTTNDPFGQKENQDAVVVEEKNGFVVRNYYNEKKDAVGEIQFSIITNKTKMLLSNLAGGSLQEYQIIDC